jgi:hypothetical protein
MTTATRARTAEKADDGKTKLARAGESGMIQLVTQRAREVVDKVHSIELEALDPAGKKALKDEITALLGSSEAAHLIKVEVDVIPMRCLGDPYEMGKISNLYSALSDCKEYLTLRLQLHAMPGAENAPLG